MPSFAKPAKLGQPQLVWCRQRWASPRIGITRVWNGLAKQQKRGSSRGPAQKLTTGNRQLSYVPSLPPGAGPSLPGNILTEAGGPAFLVFSVPVPKLWVPRPCVFARAGTMLLIRFGLSCRAACIEPTAHITCTLSPAHATGDCLFCAASAAATAFSRPWNRRACGIASWL